MILGLRFTPKIIFQNISDATSSPKTKLAWLMESVKQSSYKRNTSSVWLSQLVAEMCVLSPISCEALQATRSLIKLCIIAVKILVPVFSWTLETLIWILIFLSRVLLWRCKLGVLQYTVVRPVTTVIALYVSSALQTASFPLSACKHQSQAFFLFLSGSVSCVECTMKAISVQQMRGRIWSSSTICHSW